MFDMSKTGKDKFGTYVVMDYKDIEQTIGLSKKQVDEAMKKLLDKKLIRIRTVKGKVRVYLLGV